jgi:hypothetical protein
VSRPGLIVNGEEWSAVSQPCPAYAQPAPTERARIFDHLDRVPLALPPVEEVRHFSRIARAIKGSRYWLWPLERHDEDHGRVHLTGRVPFYAGLGETVAGEIGGAP